MEPRVEREQGRACERVRREGWWHTPERESFGAHRPHGACTEDQVIPALGERGGMCAIAAHLPVCL